MRSPLPLLVVLLGACSPSSPDMVSPPLPPLAQQVVVNGALTLTLQDLAIPSLGFLWALPTITTTAGMITFKGTTGGSICSLDVSGTSAVAGTHVTLQVTFVERPTASCSNAPSALQYTGDLRLSPGSYDVDIVFDGPVVTVPTVVESGHVVVP